MPTCPLKRAREAKQSQRSSHYGKTPRLYRAGKRRRMRHLRPSRRESAGKSRLKQQIPNVKSITER